VSLTVVDEPPDRPEWLKETLRLTAEGLERGRSRVLARVTRTNDADLVMGDDLNWGVGQIAVHVLTVERGVLGITLRLAKGQEPGATGQPRPAAAAVTRAGIAALAKKAEERAAQFLAEFPSAPDCAKTGRHPYYGDLNCFGWLLTLSNHYTAHLAALDRGTTSHL